MTAVSTLEDRSLHLKRTALVLAVTWTAATVVVFAWHLWEVYHGTLAIARVEATASFKKDVVYRRWAARHGGVYVPPTPESPPNPYLAHLEHRDVTTLSGQKLTLINPAYMTRQVHALGRQDYGHQGHITSLTPLRPENAPDAWETKALKAIAAGRPEVAEVAMIDNVAYMRLMRPLLTEASCLKCHAAHGHKEGDLRGGISVSVPIAPLRASMHHHIVFIAAGYALAAFLGSIVIGGGAFHIGQRARDRNRTENILRESEERFRAIFEGAPEGILVANSADQTFRFANPSFCRLLGYSEEALMKMKVSEIHPAEDLPAVREAFEALARGELHLAADIPCLRRDGSVFFADVSTYAVELEGTPCLVGFFTDNTQRRHDDQSRLALEAELHRQQKLVAIDTLARGASHEINNPLMGIMNYAQLIKDGLEPDGPLTEFAGEIISEAERIASITRGLSLFAAVDTQPHVSVSTSEFLQSTLDMIKTSLTRNQIILEARIPADLPSITCKTNQLQRALVSLISNAQDALNERYPESDPNKSLIITATQESGDRGRGAGGNDQYPMPHNTPSLSPVPTSSDSPLPTLNSPQSTVLSPIPHSELRIRISIEDHGSGIRKDRLERIFDPFFTTKDRAVGAGSIGKGMGLFISHAIIREHRGQLSAESDPGEWTRFHIDLPASETRNEGTVESER
jgi:PAS domain S-box-containing protein